MVIWNKVTRQTYIIKIIKLSIPLSDGLLDKPSLARISSNSFIKKASRFESGACLALLYTAGGTLKKKEENIL